MEGSTLVDVIVLAVIVLSAVLAWARGLVREALSIAGWVIAAIAGFAFAPVAEPLVREIPILKDILGSSCELGVLAGFAAVFAIALILVSFITPLLSGFVHNSAIGPIDQGLGLLFGVARGVLLVVIALVVYDRVFGVESGVEMVDASRSKAIFGDLQSTISAMLPDDGPQWIAGQYERLTENCN